ncbi:type II secretion system F family protein [Bacillus sp. BGMRC 2118]|nr:type II secretion system F family protein [Bacillus sp. BGMRC 2118]
MSHWSLEEQAKFLKWLSTLLDRGYPILAGLTFLRMNLTDKQQVLLDEQISVMKEGATFHQALVNLSFHRDVLGYLYFAEQHGNLSFALKEGSTLIEQKLQYRNKLVKILQYPLFLLAITIVIFSVLNFWLLPEFALLYGSMNTEENVLLNIMLFSAKWLPRLLVVFFVILVMILLYTLHLYRNIPLVKRMEWMSNLPLYGSYIQKFYSQFFAVQLSQLLRGGLSIYEAISLFENQSHLPLFQVEAKEMKKELRSGETLSSIVEVRRYFEKELSQAILLGSANGDLARELYFYSKLSSERLEDTFNKRLSVIQPTVFIVIGLMIMGIYLSIMQPTFQMINGL